MNTALATITPDEWPMVVQQAKMLIPTGFLPEAINTPEKALAVIMKGRELGIPAMYALSNIVIIKGKPAANAELMLSLIYRDHGDAAIEFTETTNERCTIRYKRRNARTYNSLSFTWEQAHSAGLLTPEKDRNGNPTMWHKYPEAMLRARCISAVARIAFPDTIAGMYTPDELGAETDGETGEIVEAALDNDPSEPNSKAWGTALLERHSKPIPRQGTALPRAGVALAPDDRKRDKMIARIHDLAGDYLRLTGENRLTAYGDLATQTTDQLIELGTDIGRDLEHVRATTGMNGQRDPESAAELTEDVAV